MRKNNLVFQKSLSIIFGGVLISALVGCAPEGTANSSKPAPPSASQADNERGAVQKATDRPSRALPAPADDLRTISIGNDLFVIFGPGGNIGVSVGDDGILIIDDKFARNAEGILGQLSGLSDAPLRYVLNTHFHGDHTGSNAQMAAAGAELVGHENVRKRMGMTFENKTFGRTINAVDESLWPTQVYDGYKQMQFNGYTLDLIHTPNAHTDGDSIVHFVQADTIHMGDNFFNGLFPYIDVDAGGSLAGMIAAHDKALSLASEDTQIIPGHGPMATKADLQKTRDMLEVIKSRVSARIEAGDSLDDILDANLLQDYSEYASFIDEKNMVRIAHRSLTGQ